MDFKRLFSEVKKEIKSEIKEIKKDELKKEVLKKIQEGKEKVKDEIGKVQNYLDTKIDEDEKQSLKEKREAIKNQTENVIKSARELCNEANASLTFKVNKFISWYGVNVAKGNYSEIKNISDIIEKIAIWYELNYSDVKINKKEIENVDKKELLSQLTKEEKEYISNPKYPTTIYLENSDQYFKVWNKGKIKEANGIYMKNRNYNNGKIEYNVVDVTKMFEGINITEAKDLLIEHNIINEYTVNSLNNTIKEYQKKELVQKELLNCVMYRILERSKNVNGSRRALKFAIDFKVNKDIPMMYGLDVNDVNTYLLVQEYLEARGNKDLECYINYYSRDKKDGLNKIKVSEILENMQIKNNINRQTDVVKKKVNKK